MERAWLVPMATMTFTANPIVGLADHTRGNSLHSGSNILVEGLAVVVFDSCGEINWVDKIRDDGAPQVFVVGLQHRAVRRCAHRAACGCDNFWHLGFGILHAVEAFTMFAAGTPIAPHPPRPPGVTAA